MFPVGVMWRSQENINIPRYYQKLVRLKQSLIIVGEILVLSDYSSHCFGRMFLFYLFGIFLGLLYLLALLESQFPFRPSGGVMVEYPEKSSSIFDGDFP